MPRPATRTLAALFLMLGLTATGCGSGGDHSLQHAAAYAKQDGSTIANDAREAMRSLDAMHVAGRIKEGAAVITLDLSVSKSGDCVGTVGVDDGRVHLRSTGGKAWFKADEGFWRIEAGRNAERISRVVGDRWVVLSGRLQQLQSFCHIDQLTHQMLATDARIRTAGTAMVGTTPTVRLAVTHAGVTNTAYVVASPPHYVLKIRRTTGSGSHAGEVTFSAFNEKVAVSPPPSAQIFDLSELANQPPSSRRSEGGRPHARGGSGSRG